MTTSDRKLADKFFNDECTPEEVEQVLNWFETPEGRTYLEESMDRDLEAVEKNPVTPAGINSEKMLQAIRERIGSGGYSPVRNYKKIKPLLQIAAAILLILTTGWFYQSYERVEEIGSEPVHYATSPDGQKEITLGEGTVIRLNQNSEVIVSNDQKGTVREVWLTGEAYFDVAHNPDKPFVIHARESVIEVLGTAFNVKADPAKNNVQVAVAEGRVSFSGRSDDQPAQGVILAKGQYGYLDLSRQEIMVEEFGVDNYLAWMKGRLIFNELELDKVCMQLSRLYEISCQFEEDRIRDLTLTTDFAKESLEKTLSVIALSLDISYEKRGRQVTWKHEEILGTESE